jgi:uncharacterized membrane protein
MPTIVKPTAVPLRGFWAIGVGSAALILFLCSAARHALFQSSALDLGYFDQAAYLVSQGRTPIVSFWGYHFLGGHADWIMYLVAGLYRIYPDVHWLLAIQAIALASGALPSVALARQAGLSEPHVRAIGLMYLLYPLIFNLNLFDFHPEVIALPLLLTAIWAARGQRMVVFTIGIFFSLGCRDALSITIAAMCAWLILWEKRRVYGAIALVLGIAWLLIATQWLIPHFRPAGVESVARYAYLGNSVPEIALNLVLKPQLILGRIFSIESLFYVVLLLLPVGWCLSWRHLIYLLPALPTLIINLLSEISLQRDLLHQYSLPVIPFLVVFAIAVLKAEAAWIPKPRWIMLWSIVSFIALAKYGFFTGKYLTRLESLPAMRAAIAQVQPTQDPVLTTSYFVPHLSHRSRLEYTKELAPPQTLEPYNYVLLNLQDPGWGSTPALTQQVFNQVQNDPQFQLTWVRDRIYLFQRQSSLWQSKSALRSFSGRNADPES